MCGTNSNMSNNSYSLTFPPARKKMAVILNVQRPSYAKGISLMKKPVSVLLGAASMLAFVGSVEAQATLEEVVVTA